MIIKPSTTMSHEAIRRMEARFKLQSKLLIAEKQVADNESLMEHEQVIANLRRKINATKELG